MNKVLERVEVAPTTGGAWLVNFYQHSWRFGLEFYAELFAAKIVRDENFLNGVVEHHRNHDWEKCAEQPVCEGYLWQLIQGLN